MTKERENLLDVSYELYRFQETCKPSNHSAIERLIVAYKQDIKGDDRSYKTFWKWLDEREESKQIYTPIGNFEATLFKDDMYMRWILCGHPELLKNWELAPMTGHDITKREIVKALSKGVAVVTNDPMGEISCRIRDNWFHFTDENNQTDAKAYLRNHTTEDVADAIASALHDMETDAVNIEELADEWSYYRAVLDETVK